MLEITHTSTGSKARAGILHTAHGEVQMPCFMPVATKASVKTLASRDLIELGVDNFIANAYLLHLRPGHDLIKKAGGLHGLMNWDRSIFTDSGGFQIIRSGFEPKVTDRGVLLKSPYDGKTELFTPEKCVEVQETLGSDIAMMLDDCPPHGSGRERVADAVRRTTDWAGIFLRKHNRNDQLVFLIAQGGTFPDLRKKSAEELADLQCGGYGIGGLCIGESKQEMYDMTRLQLDILPLDKTKYLMGVGTPEDIINLVDMGVDLFDSVFPTRNARHQSALTNYGTINVNATLFKENLGPIEEGCQCPSCREHTRAYLYHLFKVKELLAMRLLTLHNLYFMMSLMERIRYAIRKDEFPEFKEKFLVQYLG